MRTNTFGRAFWIMALAVGLASAAAACGGKDSPDDNKQDDPKTEQCKLEDGSTDCANPLCDKEKECRKECEEQVPTCAKSARGVIDRICAGGTCQAAGPRTEEGPLARGAFMATHTFENGLSVELLKSYAITVHHGVRPDGKALTCADLLKLENAEDPSASNIIAREADNVTASTTQVVKTPVNGVPLNEPGKKLLVLARFFNVSKDQDGEPRGEVAARGCLANVEILEGAYVEDSAHTLQMEIRPSCDWADPNSCTGGKYCAPVVGICRYKCAPACTSSAQVCRPEAEGEAPQCLRRCYPDKPDVPGCPAGFICDATASEAACLPF